MITEPAAEAWDRELDHLFTTIGHHLSRVEPRRRMRDHVRGLLAPVARENSWQLAGHVGHATENCQFGVFAAYAGTAGRALVDRELYLPKSWTEDRDRCRAAKVPDQREFAAENTLVATVVRKAPASPLPIAWVTADAAYGSGMPQNAARRTGRRSAWTLLAPALTTPPGAFEGC